MRAHPVASWSPEIDQIEQVDGVPTPSGTQKPTARAEFTGEKI
jgi:hypothetical protein